MIYAAEGIPTKSTQPSHAQRGFPVRATQNSIIIAISWTPATLILLHQQQLSETKPRKRTPQVELQQLKAPQSNWSPHLGTLFTTFICVYTQLIGNMVV